MMKPPSVPPKKGRRPVPARRAAAAPLPPTPETVADRLLALVAPSGELPALWSRAELGRRLAVADRPVLDAALARLQETRQMLVLGQGKSVFYAFAGPLRRWLEGGAVVEAKDGPAAATAEPPALDEVYRRLVRQSGGFPDVKIAALQAGLGGPAAGGGTLAGELVARWRRGEATLSLGDWSLASEETRAAAVELDGEKYLLVRLEEAD